MPSILFVCTGNQCRSPVAAQLFQASLQNISSSQEWLVTSAGVWPTTGNRSPSNLIRVAKATGIHLQSHRARSIDDVAEIANFDLIVTMEQNQRESLRVEFPTLAQHIHLLSALAGPAYDIADPMGGNDEEYQWMIDELRQLIAKALPEILRLVESFSLREQMEIGQR